MTDSYRHALNDSKLLLCHPEPVEGSIETTSALAVSLTNTFKGYIEVTPLGRGHLLRYERQRSLQGEAARAARTALGYESKPACGDDI